MENLETYFAVVENIEAGKHSRNLHNAISGIDDLSFEGVLVIVIEREVGGESVPHEGILVGKDDLDVVILRIQPLLFNLDLMAVVDNLVFFDFVSVDGQEHDGLA